MKKTALLFAFIAFNLVAMACPVCERNQPKPLRGIVHGAGPESNWDYVTVWVTVVIALATLFFSIKWLIKPGETNPDHIKYSILNTEKP